MDNDIEKKTCNIVKNLILKEGLTHDVTQETVLQDIGINSVNFMQIIVGVENEFDFEFDDDQLHIRYYTTIKNLIDYIQLKVQ